MKYYIIAGEASGDLHGSLLIRGLYKSDKNALIRFWGGELMEAAYREGALPPLPSCGMVRDYKDTAVMGFFELVGKAGKIAANLSFCKKDIAGFNPDVVILIDYPGFNLNIARWAHSHSFKVFYYIAPKVWASREGRLRSMKKNIDELFIIFPFEKEYFASKGVPCHYFGNPLMEEISSCAAMQTDRNELRDGFGIAPDEMCVAFLAGSRLNEVRTMMPIYNEVVKKLSSRHPYLRFFIAGAPGRKDEDYGDFDRDKISLVFGKTREILRASDAAAINSGTASLEAALLGTPQVVVYKVKSALSYYLAKWFLLKCKYISLGNLCLDRLVFKELYRNEECNAAVVGDELERLLTDEAYRRKMFSGYDEIKQSLSGEGTSAKVAGKMVEILSAGRN